MKKQLEETIKKNVLSCFEKHDFNASWKEQSNQYYNEAIEYGKKTGIKDKDVEETSDLLLESLKATSKKHPVATTILSIHYTLCLNTILSRWDHKNEEVRKIIDELLNFKYVGAYLASELGYGVNIKNMSTTATYNRKKKGFILNSNGDLGKKFMPNVGNENIGRYACVLSRVLDDEGNEFGIHPIIVKIRHLNGKTAQGIKVECLGASSGFQLDNAVTSFENVFVKENMALLNGYVEINEGKLVRVTNKSDTEIFNDSVSSIDKGKVSFCYSGYEHNFAGAAIAYYYAKHKNTFTPGNKHTPLIELKNVYSDIIQTAVTGLVCEKNIQKSIQSIRDNKSHKNINSHAVNATKIFNVETTESNLLKMRDRTGSQGFMSSNNLIDYIICYFGLKTAEGCNEVLSIKIGSDCLRGKENLVSTRKSLRPIKINLKKDNSQNVLEYLYTRKKAKLKRKIAVLKLKNLTNEDIYKRTIEDIKSLGKLYVDSWVVNVAQEIHSNCVNPKLLKKYFGLLMYKKHYKALLEEKSVNAKNISKIEKEMDKIEVDISENLDYLIKEIEPDFDLLQTSINPKGFESSYLEKESNLKVVA
ncbi:hypothetical protein A3715_15385 [Oleiphilus sp. HI0009]|nr:hypothetical protein A3715_15385 [Oleiphilus sp. HI0009]